MSTRWMPDTCGCSIIVKDDWSGATKFETKCALHAGLDDDAAFQAVRDHNTSKNEAANLVTELHPNNYRGAFVRDDKGTITLQVDLPESDLANLRQRLDQKFGAGKIRVEPSNVAVVLQRD